MEYKMLHIIKELLDNEMSIRINLTTKYESAKETLKKSKKNIQNMIKSSKNINQESLRLIEQIISKNDLDIKFDKEIYKRALGDYYMEPNETSKAKVQEVLNPIMRAIDVKIETINKTMAFNNDLLNVSKKIYEALTGLLESTNSTNIKPVMGDIFFALNNYIFNLPFTILSEEDKIRAMEEFNILNVRALQRREAVFRKNNGDNTINQVEAKQDFEFENEMCFDEIINMCEYFELIQSKLDEKTTNQLISVANEFKIDIITSTKVKDIQDYIEIIKAPFTADFFIKYIILKEIKDWYDLYKKADSIEELMTIYEVIEEAVDAYNDYIEQTEELFAVNDEDEEENDIIYLQDDRAQIVGIDWINNDNHGYGDSDYRDLENGFKKIRHSSKEKLLNDTYRVKKAGIPGVSESKFRRVRYGTSRIIYLDLNNIIDDKYKPYLVGLNTVYLVLNFGQKAGETDIYRSMNIKVSPRIPNLLINYKAFINSNLENIYLLNIPDEVKKTQMETFIRQQITNSNALYDEAIKNAKGHHEKSKKVENGGPKND